MRSTRRRAWAGLVAALAVLVAVPGWWVASQPPDAAGVVPTEVADPAPSDGGASPAEVADPAPSAPPERRTDAAKATADPGANPAVRTQSARIGDLEKPAVVEPTGLRIDAIGVAADIVPAGVEEGTGAFAVPEDVATVGWYRHGPAPGSSAGTAVLAGHVDSAEQGPGALSRLAELEPGASVSVTLADDNELAYEVVARRRIAKEALPTDGLFTHEGDPTLVLITCGGAFDSDRGSYTDNVVVWAVPR